MRAADEPCHKLSVSDNDMFLFAINELPKMLNHVVSQESFINR